MSGAGPPVILGAMTATPTAPPAFDPRAYCRTLTQRPGVYRMLDGRGTVIYVGKARNLKKRVSSYFNASRRLEPKTGAMVAQVVAIEVTATHTENEALILECNLIKELRPRYNVVLRDDKSYPYIHLSAGPYPRLSFHRGARSRPGRYFGPYSSAGATRETLHLLQKLFQVRPCRDSIFNNRSRPCLQHQIKRCSAPCVQLIGQEAYAADVAHAVMFLEGRSQEAIDGLVQRMEAASAALDFEQAARLRNQIWSLQRIQQRQYVSAGNGDVDVIACVAEHGVGCVQVFSIRGGHNLGNKAFFPEHTGDTDEAAILAAFLPQYYLAGQSDRVIPRRILLSHALAEVDWLAGVLSDRLGRSVSLQHEVRAERARWLDMALENARIALTQRLASRSGKNQRTGALAEALGLEAPLERIECFDISHTRGEATVASCVVFGPEGALKSDYRRFNIEGITPGDDYAAMQQALTRRYSRVQREEGRLPDLLLIDGGRGQVAEAQAVLESLQIDGVMVVGVAKGPSRKPGLETLVLVDDSDRPGLRLPGQALHLVQEVRDEAHRFAITGHRQRRARARRTSPLEDVPGIGARRRQALIQHFGGLQGVQRAGVEDLAKVPGINRALALKIYELFHE